MVNENSILEALSQFMLIVNKKETFKTMWEGVVCTMVKEDIVTSFRRLYVWLKKCVWTVSGSVEKSRKENSEKFLTFFLMCCTDIKYAHYVKFLEGYTGKYSGS
jgi:hypothetical protein